MATDRSWTVENRILDVLRGVPEGRSISLDDLARKAERKKGTVSATLSALMMGKPPKVIRTGRARYMLYPSHLYCERCGRQMRQWVDLGPLGVSTQDWHAVIGKPTVRVSELDPDMCEDCEDEFVEAVEEYERECEA